MARIAGVLPNGQMAMFNSEAEYAAAGARPPSTTELAQNEQQRAAQGEIKCASAQVGGTSVNLLDPNAVAMQERNKTVVATIAGAPVALTKGVMDAYSRGGGAGFNEARATIDSVLAGMGIARNSVGAQGGTGNQQDAKTGMWSRNPTNRSASPSPDAMSKVLQTAAMFGVGPGFADKGKSDAVAGSAIFTGLAYEAAKKRPGYYGLQGEGFAPEKTIGDSKSQGLSTVLGSLGTFGMVPAFRNKETTTGIALDVLRQDAYAQGNTKAAQYYGGETGKLAQRPVERSAEYHFLGKSAGVPVPANPWEYQADLAVEFLKGAPQKASEKFSPVSGEMAPHLPGGFLGAQDWAWRVALNTDKPDKYRQMPNVSYVPAIMKLGEASGQFGPYGKLHGGPNYEGTPSSEGIRKQESFRFTTSALDNVLGALGKGRGAAPAAVAAPAAIEAQPAGPQMARGPDGKLYPAEFMQADPTNWKLLTNIPATGVKGSDLQANAGQALRRSGLLAKVGEAGQNDNLLKLAMGGFGAIAFASPLAAPLALPGVMFGGRNNVLVSAKGVAGDLKITPPETKMGFAENFQTGLRTGLSTINPGAGFASDTAFALAKGKPQELPGYEVSKNLVEVIAPSGVTKEQYDLELADYNQNLATYEARQKAYEEARTALAGDESAYGALTAEYGTLTAAHTALTERKAVLDKHAELAGKDEGVLGRIMKTYGSLNEAVAPYTTDIAGIGRAAKATKIEGEGAVPEVARLGKGLLQGTYLSPIDLTLTYGGGKAMVLGEGLLKHGVAKAAMGKIPVVAGAGRFLSSANVGDALTAGKMVFGGIVVADSAKNIIEQPTSELKGQALGATVVQFAGFGAGMVKHGIATDEVTNKFTDRLIRINNVINQEPINVHAGKTFFSRKPDAGALTKVWEAGTVGLGEAELYLRGKPQEAKILDDAYHVFTTVRNTQPYNPNARQQLWDLEDVPFEHKVVLDDVLAKTPHSMFGSGVQRAQGVPPEKMPEGALGHTPSSDLDAWANQKQFMKALASKEGAVVISKKDMPRVGGGIEKDVPDVISYGGKTFAVDIHGIPVDYVKLPGETLPRTGDVNYKPEWKDLVAFRVLGDPFYVNPRSWQLTQIKNDKGEVVQVYEHSDVQRYRLMDALRKNILTATSEDPKIARGGRIEKDTIRLMSAFEDAIQTERLQGVTPKRELQLKAAEEALGRLKSREIAYRPGVSKEKLAIEDLLGKATERDTSRQIPKWENQIQGERANLKNQPVTRRVQRMKELAEAEKLITELKENPTKHDIRTVKVGDLQTIAKENLDYGWKMSGEPLTAPASLGSLKSLKDYPAEPQRTTTNDVNNWLGKTGQKPRAGSAKASAKAAPKRPLGDIPYEKTATEDKVAAWLKKTGQTAQPKSQARPAEQAAPAQKTGLLKGTDFGGKSGLTEAVFLSKMEMLNKLGGQLTVFNSSNKGEAEINQILATANRYGYSFTKPTKYRAFGDDGYEATMIGTPKSPIPAGGKLKIPKPQEPVITIKSPDRGIPRKPRGLSITIGAPSSVSPETARSPEKAAAIERKLYGDKRNIGPKTTIRYGGKGQSPTERIRYGGEVKSPLKPSPAPKARSPKPLAYSAKMKSPSPLAPLKSPAAGKSPKASPPAKPGYTSKPPYAKPPYSPKPSNPPRSPVRPPSPTPPYSPGGGVPVGAGFGGGSGWGQKGGGRRLTQIFSTNFGKLTAQMFTPSDGVVAPVRTKIRSGLKKRTKRGR